MRNSKLLKVFLALLICTAYLTGFSYAGEAVWDYLSNGDRFKPNTQIASIDISGLPQREAAQKVEDSIKDWRSANPIKLTFLKREEILPEAAIQFKVDESVRNAADGQPSQLEVSLDSMLVDRILADLASNDAAQIDMDQIKKQLTDSVAKLEAGLHYNLEKYVAGEEQIIHEASLPVPVDDPEILKFVKSNPSIKVKALSQWSLVEQFPEATNQDSLGMIASAVFKTVLGTNFVVVERHTGVVAPPYTDPGFEAKIIPKEMDLKIFNPNQTDYTLVFEISGENLTVKISGKPLLYKYEPVIPEPEYFPFKQIIRYNTSLSVGEEKKIRDGADGILVKVTRRITDHQGYPQGIEEIAEDFYPPIHEILEKRYYQPIEVVDEVINNLLNPVTGLPEGVAVPAGPLNPDSLPATEEQQPPASASEQPADETNQSEEEKAVPAENTQPEKLPEALGENTASEKEPIEK
ncbi:VanW family protein [Bacillus sp. FJAT-42376]|uniref:VanW family protein n=1 Tax=Bacillus sp. FJAT-42376 TaxID=2014076 RepID=UPI001F151BD2|nr:VanW family protein [Bacillus sp. FJAT-42376]